MTTDMTTWAEVTWPGSPMIALATAFVPAGVSILARMVGLPGLMAMPWARTCAPGWACMAATVWSRAPSELPPDTSTTSHSARAAARA